MEAPDRRTMGSLLTALLAAAAGTPQVSVLPFEREDFLPAAGLLASCGLITL